MLRSVQAVGKNGVSIELHSPLPPFCRSLPWLKILQPILHEWVWNFSWIEKPLQFVSVKLTIGGYAILRHSKCSSRNASFTCLERCQVRHILRLDPNPTTAFIAPCTHHVRTAVGLLGVCPRLRTAGLNIGCLHEKVCRMPVGGPIIGELYRECTMKRSSKGGSHCTGPFATIGTISER